MLKNDPRYADKAEQLSGLAVDISEFIENEDPGALRPEEAPTTPIAFHAPCSLQHGLKRAGRVERLLTSLGYELTPVADAHICCGSAGSYSVLQRELSNRLLGDKVRNLEAGEPSLIATANIGCLAHLENGTDIPVRHWVQLLA